MARKPLTKEQMEAKVAKMKATKAANKAKAVLRAEVEELKQGLGGAGHTTHHTPHAHACTQTRTHIHSRTHTHT